MLALRFLVARRSFSSCHVKLSGHNKWSKIKQKKGANDAQRSAVFGKVTHDIIAAVQSGGSADPTKNTQLAAVLKRAKDLDVPKGNIENALSKASRSGDKASVGDNFVYEAMYDSIGLIIECWTGNANRTIHSVRAILNDYNARAAPVKFMFQRVGRVSILSPKDSDCDHLIDMAYDAGATDFDSMDSRIVFTCPADRLSAVTTLLTSQGESIIDSELIYAPLEGSTEPSDDAKNNLKLLIDKLKENEDVYRVWSSLDPNIDSN